MSTPEILDNFFSALVGEIRARKPDYLREPFTVAEIYQNLVPYRTHRDRIGVEMNADYEDALLRLLAGEGDLLVLESDTARGEIATELKSSNPNTLMYRDYAAAMVRLNPALAVDPADALPDGAPPASVGPDREEEAEPRPSETGSREPVAIEELAPSEPTKTLEFPAPGPVLDDPVEKTGAVGKTPAQPKPPAEDPALEDLVGADYAAEARIEAAAPEASPGEGIPSGSQEAEDRCQSCLGELPGRSVLNFCPLCGTDLRTPACPSCGEELESEWRFCVVCGTKAPEQ